MANPNPRLENLNSYKPKWKSGKTRTIRVPVAIAERVLEVAHQIDEGKLADTSEYVSKDNTVDSDKDEIKKLKSRIEELEHQLISVTSVKKCTTNPDATTNKKFDSNQDNITDTSQSFDRKKARAIISEGLSYRANLGGKIKVSLAQLGNLLGFKIENLKNKWVMLDTSELTDMKEIEKIISEGLSTSSQQGSKIKTNLAQIGNLLGFKLKRKGRGGKWVFTDTSD